MQLSVEQNILHDTINFANGFYSVFDENNERVLLEGRAPNNFVKRIDDLLINSNISSSLDASYDYKINDFQEYSLYIYKVLNDNKKSFIVVGIKNHSKLHEIVLTLPIGIIKVNSKWQVYYANEYTESLLGLSQGEIFGNEWSKIFSIDLISEIHSYFYKNFSNFGAFKKIIEVITPLGRKSIVSISINQNREFQSSKLFYIITLQDITKEYESNKQIEFNATHDSLTKLLNRNALLEKIVQSYKEDKLKDSALLFLDINNFKRINDIFGHNFGDKILKIIAKKLTNITKERDIISRIGGDEFIVFLNNIGDQINSINIAKTILHNINQNITIDGRSIDIICSAGLSFGSQIEAIEGDTELEEKLIDHWFNTADIAMYESKKKQTGEIIVFDKSFHKKYVDEIERQKFIKKTISEDNVNIYFQPIYYKESIHSLEALSIFESEPFDTSIQKLIDTSVRTGLSLEFFQYLFNSGLLAYSKLVHNLTIQNYPSLNINISVQQLIQDDFVKNTIDYIEQLNLSPNLIYLEITEQALESEESVFHNNINLLKKSGFKFSIDDFGTGYSSIKRLVDYDFDQIKLDRSFFKDIQINKRLQLALKTASLLGENLEMEVLAEGIELEIEHIFAKELGLSYMQGYLFAKPMCINDIKKLLENKKD